MLYSPRFPRRFRQRVPPPDGFSYRGIGLRPAERVPRVAAEASPTHHRKMISNRALAQNEKRNSKDDACRDDGAELGKHRPDAAGSKFRGLAPCSRTKLVHVGLHVQLAAIACA